MVSEGVYVMCSDILLSRVWKMNMSQVFWIVCVFMVAERLPCKLSVKEYLNDFLCAIVSGNGSIWRLSFDVFFSFHRGSAIAKIVGHNAKGNNRFDPIVNMWVFEEMVNGKKLTEIINTEHENVKYLPGHKLPKNVVSSLLCVSDCVLWLTGDTIDSARLKPIENASCMTRVFWSLHSHSHNRYLWMAWQ